MISAAEVGRLAGVRVPVLPMSHEYIVTQPFRDRDPARPLPTLLWKRSTLRPR